MSHADFITELFCRVDDQLGPRPKHFLSNLYLSEVITIGMLFALKGDSGRDFYRWLKQNWKIFFPCLPERTRLFRCLQKAEPVVREFLAQPTVLGIADTYGIELIHPHREGRSKQQIGRKGLSNHRWIVGVKLGVVINKFGQVVGWKVDTANVHDSHFSDLVASFDEEMIVFTDTGFHAKQGDPANMKVCKKGTWNDRMLVETVFSMKTLVKHTKKMGQRTWRYLESRIGYLVGVFNVLTTWRGLLPDKNGFVSLSIAEFSL
jgi:hypothetical protein